METLTKIFQSKLKYNFEGFRNKNICFIKKENEEVYVTYEQLYQKASCILNYLQIKGIKPGEELVILQDDNEIFIYLFWACILGGIIPVPISASGNDEHKWKLVNVWRKLNNPHLVTNEKLLDSFERFTDKRTEIHTIALNIKNNTILISEINMLTPGIIHTARPNDIALIQFSSGSTGDPKGVVLTHKNLITNIKAIIKGSQFTHDDIALSWLPLTHDMGLIGFHLTPFVFGFNQINLQTSLFIRRPLLWIDKASKHKATLLSSPNFGYKYFLSFLKPDTVVDWDLSHVRLIYNGAEPISSKLCKEFSAKMNKYGLKDNVIFSVYGLAEASLAVSFPPLGEQLISLNLNRNYLDVGGYVEELDADDFSGISFVDVGYPVENCEVRICDSDLNVLEERKIGHIQIRGGNVTTGYYNNQSAKEQLRDGWLDTGDLGLVMNGRLVVTGRVKDVIFVNGQNYYSHDIERVAQELEEVKLGEIVACGVSNSEAQKEDIVLFVLYKKKVENFLQVAINIKKYIYKHMGLEIKDVVPVKKIPKTTSGKIMRFKLEEMYLKGAFLVEIRELNKLLAIHGETKSVENTVCALEEQLINIWSEILGNKNISVNDNFLEMGGTSILLANFCNQIEANNFGKISLMDLFSYSSIRKLAKFLASENKGQVENITLLQVKLPEDYFCVLKDYNSSSYLFEIQGAPLKAVIAISEIVGSTPEDVLLNLFSYELHRIAKQDEITIQAMIKSDGLVEMLTIKFNEINEISQLFKVGRIKHKYNNAYTYLLHNINNFNINKDQYSITPFFYNETMLKMNFDLLSVYDITLGIIKTSNSINLTFDYNAERLNSQKMKEFINSYIKLIYLLVQKYEIKNQEMIG